MRADLTTEVKKTCINRSEKLKHKKAIFGLLFLLFNPKPELGWGYLAKLKTEKKKKLRKTS